MSGHILDGKRTVQSVINDVHPCKSKLCTYLMRHSRIDCHLKKSALFIAFARSSNRNIRSYGMEGFCRKGTALRLGKPSLPQIHHLAVSKTRHMNKIVLKRSAKGDRAFDKRKIRLLYCLRRKL